MSNAYALIIASDSYTDEKLTQLRAPTIDAKKLGNILQDVSIGGYEVKVLDNRLSHELAVEIENFFSKAKKEDLLLLYFAGHGHKKIKNGRLYLATINTKLTLLESTSIPAKFINEQIQNSPASKIIVILDCCYSGAFSRDMIAHSEATLLNIPEEFRENESGCVILTSATAMQYSWEGSNLKKEEQGIEIGKTAGEASSFYTNLLIKGIESEEADENKDGTISCNELCNYLKRKMKENNYPQKPEIYLLKDDLTIAYSTKSKLTKESTSISTKALDKALQERKDLIYRLLQNNLVTEFNNLRKSDD